MATAKNTKAEDILKQGLDALTKNADQFSSFAKENVEAAIEVANIAAKGAEKIAAEVAACSKQNIEQNIATAKELAAVRSFEQLITVQTQYSKQAFEQYVAQATKIGDLMLSLSKEASAPLNTRFNAFSEQFAKKAS